MPLSFERFLELPTWEISETNIPVVPVQVHSGTVVVSILCINFIHSIEKIYYLLTYIVYLVA